jgi:hypothetical protein
MMPDLYIEQNRYAQRRMADHLKPIDALLTKWAPEARHDGAPRWPAATMLARIIGQGANGASQSGASVNLAAEPVIEFIDWAVSRLMPMQRHVIFAEYVHFPGWVIGRKCAMLRMTEAQWNTTLRDARGGVYLLYTTYGHMLGLETI